MPGTSTRRRGPQRGLLAVAVAACVGATLVVAGPAAGSPHPVVGSAPGVTAGAADESQDFPFPGGDTMALHDGSGKYITYGASARGRNVPYSISGSGDVVATSPTIKGDALPHGGGAWTKPGSGIWTPGAFYQSGRYYLFYTAVQKGTDGKHCVGVASSAKPTTGFTSAAAPLVCPSRATRWAIDADVTTGPQGAIWLVWRDGERADSGDESALSAMTLTLQQGTVASHSAPAVIMRSDSLAWPHYQRPKNGVTVLENPSALYHNGSWYLFYSGNSWSTNYYSTGIAYCGAALDGGLCTPLPGPNRAYFSYSGPKAHLPAGDRLNSLPGNKRGPGAMDVYLARDGKPWVTWNYLTGSSGTGRKSRVGRLHITGSGASASFSVTLS